MPLRNVRPWQWMAVGALCGLLVGGVRTAWGPSYRDEVSRTIPQDQFERGVCSPPTAPLHLNGLVVHPPDETGARWVTGTLYERSGGTERIEAFKFRAPTPFEPKVAMGSSALTVYDYLSQIDARIPQAQLRFRYAWEEAPGALVWLWTAVGAIAIGIIWPLALRRLAGPPAAGIDYALLTGPAADQSKPVGPEGVDALNQWLEERLITEPLTPPSLASDQDSGSAPALRALTIEPIGPAPAPEPEPPKSYGGDYYPTEAHAVRETSRGLGS